MNHIELFAGCGGLSLGLESEGFDLLLANELSPMAGETFAYNHLGLNLADNGIRNNDPVYWISSEHSRDNSEARLKENPHIAAGLKNKITDLVGLENHPEKLRRSLLIGSILDLNTLLKKPKLKKALRAGLGDGEVDLVSGGPPCQSFSMAGMRQHSNERNSLPWAFAEFVRQVQPKMTLLENVSGILRAFDIEGDKYYAWYEVAKAFAIEGYVPLCLHVNAKYAGAAQNRPRFVMLAFRKDVFTRVLKNNLEKEVGDALNDSLKFFKLVIKEGEQLQYGHLKCHDVESSAPLFNSKLFESLTAYRSENVKLVTAMEAIDDLNGSNKSPSDYVKAINHKSYQATHAQKYKYEEWRGFLSNETKPSNQEHRGNNNRVRARFRLYQVLNKLESNKVKSEIKLFLKSGDESLVSKQSLEALACQDWLLNEKVEKVEKVQKIVGKTAENMLNLLVPLQTKKQTQKALVADKPAPAALSIPDDACHYDDAIQRTLTVREMARFQSFPDWFVFRSKVTTGGLMRRYQVPQYTQVGNAVPPLLGKALGQVCKKLLDLEQNQHELTGQV
jgi:DNA (cytosine-5)-methyltransferase 1